MPKVTYIEHNGTEHSVNVDQGSSLMEGAVSNSVPGIDGDCGGGAACGTCHVYVDPDWIAKTGVAEDAVETSMLQFAEDVKDNSRLSCQITMSEELDGLILRMPEAQF